MKQKRKWKPAIIIMIFSILLISCTTSPSGNNITPEVPSIENEDGELIIIYGDKDADDSGNFSMRIIRQASDPEAQNPWVALPLWYWKKVVRYFVDTQ